MPFLLLRAWGGAFPKTDGAGRFRQRCLPTKDVERTINSDYLKLMSLNSSVLTSIAEAAGRLDVSIKLVRRYIAAGDLVATRVKGIWRIDVESIERLKLNPSIVPDGYSRDLFGKIIKSSKASIKRTKKGPDLVNWVDIRRKWKSPGKSDLTFVDLFSGAGGITKGLELAGLHGICGLDLNVSTNPAQAPLQSPFGDAAA